MRAGLSTIQQTLTPDAAAILNQSISEACRRNHGQTTPLHVAATLLSSPSGFLRQACIRSHPNSSHPLQCRALELCFSVSLERLPTAQSMSPGVEPPISNALMAALKRAQAHQRRGCPEQQQQPLLAVKVELDQLIISILDDPSVSRVMREASFSSPAVKAAIEQSVNTSNSGPNVNFGPRMLPNSGLLTAPYGATCKSQVLGPLMQTPSPVNRNPYLNPRLQAGPPGTRSDDVKRVYEIMSRSKKRNPIIVADSEPDSVVRELLRKIENQELGNEGIFKNVQVISMEKGANIKEIGEMIDSRIGSGGVILDLGDLRWLVEHQQPRAAVESGRTAVVEMSRLLARFSGNEENKVWLIGSATCETYLRCQVYHSTMENDWALQPVPVASRSPAPGIFPRHLSNPVEPLTPIRAVPTRPASENFDSCEKTTLCPQCSSYYEKELAKLTAIQKSFSEASLPQWLQNAKLNTTDDPSQGKDSGLLPKQKTQELQKKWMDLCLHLHPTFHKNNRADRQSPPTLSMTTGLYGQNQLARPIFQPKLQSAKPIGEVLQLNTDRATSQPGPVSPPGSPVRTDLVLGRKETEKDVDNRAKDFLGCISSTKLLDKFSNASDADKYKKLLKGLMQRAWWQAEAASAVATAITRCQLGNGERRGGGSRGDTWLMFAGPDRVGKKKMAMVIAEQMCGARPVMICLGTRRDDEELDMNFRGKTVSDRIAEAVRRYPSSVIMLQDIDESDTLVRGNIKRAMARGRIADSHGREVSLGNTIFVLTGDWSSASPDGSRAGVFVEEKKLASVASGNWQLGLIVREKTSKRRASWPMDDDDRPLKPRKEPGSGLSLDLNLGTCEPADDQADGSHNSSDLTVDHEDEFGHVDHRHFPVTSVPQDLVNNVDECVAFKPVDATFVRQEIKKTISLKFSAMVDEDVALEVEDDVLERILGGLWHDRTSLEEWAVKVLEPSFDRLKPQLRSGLLVRLVVESDSGRNGSGDWLPSSISV